MIAEYLGDGLYAEEGGFGEVILKTDRGGIEHWVALEPVVLNAFFQWLERARGLKITVERAQPDRAWRPGPDVDPEDLS